MRSTTRFQSWLDGSGGGDRMNERAATGAVEKQKDGSVTVRFGWSPELGGGGC